MKKNEVVNEPSPNNTDDRITYLFATCFIKNIKFYSL